MSDANDDTQNYALGAIAAVVALVIAGVLTLAISRSGAPKAPAAAAVAAAAPAEAALPRVYFEVDSDALPADAMDVLNRVADAARANPGAAVLISGFHDASGNPEHNADLAKRRAQAVRHALEANGVPAAQLVLDKPQQTLGGGDPREARRVELKVQ
ncbi:MAG: OmpA family protein [Piscinibacter sp.]|uniref:OmpA family protein n=1 Tax=Piscinibacter sp. TaxID=1903157 RepID=UPI003D0F673F